LLTMVVPSDAAVLPLPAQYGLFTTSPAVHRSSSSLVVLPPISAPAPSCSPC
jgi:hypothetical protein